MNSGLDIMQVVDSKVSNASSRGTTPLQRRIIAIIVLGLCMLGSFRILYWNQF